MNQNQKAAQAVARENAIPMDLDLGGLKFGFSATHPDPPLCAICGEPIAGLADPDDEESGTEIPLWLFKGKGKACLSLPLHLECGMKRVRISTQKAFAA